MPSKKTQASTTPAKKTAAPTTPEKKTTAVKAKAPVKPKAGDAEHTTLKLEKNNKPTFLDQPHVPGMNENVPGYDAGIPKWLFESGLTIQVDKNWAAKPGDIITVGRLLDDETVRPLALKTLKPGEEQENNYFFSAPHKDLADGPHALVYVVNYEGGPDYDVSFPLLALIKTDLPAGDDNDQIEPGHSELKFSVSESVIVPENAANGVTITLPPYPNMDPGDQVILHWGSVIITQTVAGLGKPTVITVTYQDIVQAGDSDRLITWLEVIDRVGNISTPGSASQYVSVTLDVTKYDGPAMNAGPVGYIDLEVLAERPLELQMFTSASIGRPGDLYDVMFRVYPPQGGVKVIHKFVLITSAGKAYSVFIDYIDVRAAAGGRVSASFVLRRGTAPFEIYSKITNAEVRGSITRLEAPHAEGYPDDYIHDNPPHVIVPIPYYAWRQPTDEISLILRYVKNLNEIIVHIEKKEVGSSWPDGSPVMFLIYREALQKFKGYRPQLYYVISTNFTRARAVDLNESLRRVLTIS